MLSGANPAMCMHFTLKLKQIQHRTLCNNFPACTGTLGEKAVNFLHGQNLVTLKPYKNLDILAILTGG